MIRLIRTVETAAVYMPVMAAVLASSLFELAEDAMFFVIFVDDPACIIIYELYSFPPVLYHGSFREKP